jgi:hypothetical protein
MNLLPGLNWLTAMTARRVSAQANEHAPDPADMGTAFGLDASMAPEPEETPRAPVAAPAPRGDRLVRRPRR